MKKIVICTSASFYKQAVAVQAELQQAGYDAIIPTIAEVMKKSGDYDVSHYKTWYENDADYTKKAELIRGHFAEVADCDAILVLNYEKHGKPNYIGGNVLMEMSLAFYLNIPIFILNDIPTDSAFLEEIKGMQPTCLKGDLKQLPV